MLRFPCMPPSPTIPKKPEATNTPTDLTCCAGRQRNYSRTTKRSCVCRRSPRSSANGQSDQLRAEFGAAGPTPEPQGLEAPRPTSAAALALPADPPGPRAPRRRRLPEPAPGRGSRGRGARARRGKGRGHGAVTWARALARRVHSPAAARPLTRRARGFPRRPGGLLDPRPKASGAGCPSSAPRRCPRGPGRLELPGHPAAGGLSRGAPDSPHPLPPPGRPRSRGEGGKSLLRRAGGRERGLSHPSRSVTAAATTTRAVLLLPTCREDTEHARAETTSGRKASKKCCRPQLEGSLKLASVLGLLQIEHLDSHVHL